MDAGGAGQRALRRLFEPLTAVIWWAGRTLPDARGAFCRSRRNAWPARDPAGRSPAEAAILRVVEAFGPPQAAALARSPGVSIRFLDYDWTLNDAARTR